MLDRPMAHKRLIKPPAPRGGYRPPTDVRMKLLTALLRETHRGELAKKQLALLQPSHGSKDDVSLYFAGDLSLLDRPCVAIVGSRNVSEQGLLRARRLSRELVNSGFVVVSGLAAGVDAASHKTAIETGGNTIAVIGTPLNKAYPAENKHLQEEIYREHLLISPFEEGEATFKSSFPKRNRVMAAITDATVIIEASDTSGTLHQAAECIRLGRWLFISRSLIDNPEITWPRKFLKEPRCRILTATSEVVDAVITERDYNL